MRWSGILWYHRAGREAMSLGWWRPLDLEEERYLWLRLGAALLAVSQHSEHRYANENNLL